MNWIDSPSSAIKRFAYNPESLVLSIHFHSTGIYHYHGVTPERFEAFQKAPSHGSHFNANLAGRHQVTRDE